jgi:hypothetical protein
MCCSLWFTRWFPSTSWNELEAFIAGQCMGRCINLLLVKSRPCLELSGSLRMDFASTTSISFWSDMCVTFFVVKSYFYNL